MGSYCVLRFQPKNKDEATGACGEGRKCRISFPQGLKPVFILNHLRHDSSRALSKPDFHLGLLGGDHRNATAIGGLADPGGSGERAGCGRGAGASGDEWGAAGREPGCDGGA